MEDKILKWLYNIDSAINEIESYLINEKMDFF